MSSDRTRSRTIVPTDRVPRPAFPEDVPEDLLYGLTAPERAFVRCYVESGNAYEAYLKAGLEHGQRHTKTLASQYLQKARVKAAVNRVQGFFMKHIGIHAEQILGLLHSHSTFDPMTIYEQDGDSWELLPMARWPLEARQCVQRIRVIERTSKDGEVRREIDLEFADRQRALITLAKHLRLLERKDQTAPFTLILNAGPEVTEKQVGQVINGIGLEIRVPDVDER